MIDYAEKRDFLRMPIDCELHFGRAGEEPVFQGNVINLSSKGILFTSPQRFSEGSSLDLVLTPSNSEEKPMHARAVVSRITDNNALFEIACEIKTTG